MNRITLTPTAEDRLVRLATAFDDQSDDEILVEIPEDLTTLDDDALDETLTNATEAFNALYDPDDEAPSAETLEQLEVLSEAIVNLSGERDNREGAAAERAERAAAAAARVNGEATDDTDDTDEGDDDGDDDGDDTTAEDEAAVVAEAEEAARAAAETEEEAAVTAGTSAANRPINIAVRGRGRRRVQTDEPVTPGRLNFRGTGGGRTDGATVEGRSLGELVAQRVGSVPRGTVQQAFASGRTYQQRLGSLVLNRAEQPGYDPALVVDSDSEEAIAEVINHAVDESRLEGGSLTAAGTGWCSMSEVIYEQTDCGIAPGAALFSLPEVVMARGGLRFYDPMSFPEISEAYSGFDFSEDEAIAGDYANTGTGESEKPCHEIVCGTDTEVRLRAAGVCFTGDILMRRTQPERIARFTEIALAAHMRRMSGLKLAKVAAGSTSVTAPAQASATAGLLTFIELQVEYVRNRYNLAENATMEAVLPHWVRAVLRGDLAKRQGLDLFDVTDARLDAHFRSRGINPQYVYGWQSLQGATPSDPPTAFPSTVDVLVYPAGTWVGGTNDIIEIDTLFDSTLLKQNKYVGLFVEEGWEVFNRGCVSLNLTVPFSADGATHGGVDIAHDGSLVPVGP